MLPKSLPLLWGWAAIVARRENNKHPKLVPSPPSQKSHPAGGEGLRGGVAEGQVLGAAGLGQGRDRGRAGGWKEQTERRPGTGWERRQGPRRDGGGEGKSGDREEEEARREGPREQRETRPGGGRRESGAGGGGSGACS